MATCKIVFMSSGIRGRVERGTTILNAARQLGVDLDSVCGGRAICGRCQVSVVEGKFPKHDINSARSGVSAATETELRFVERRPMPSSDDRLGCQGRILDDVIVDVPASSQVHRPLVRKDAMDLDVRLDTATRLYYVEVPAAALDRPEGHLQRLLAALASEWGLPGLGADPAILSDLSVSMQTGESGLTVAVRDASTVVAVWSGFVDDLFGIAIDIGSTTIAAHLCSLVSGEVLATTGTMNPQVRFGEDLMSRVSYAQMHPEGAEALTEAVRSAMNELIADLVAEADILLSQVLELVVVGNPIMHHIFLGISPVELGSAPFALTTSAAIKVGASGLGLDCGEAASVYLLPCVAGHVGADTAGMVLADGLHKRSETALIVDIGTNAEIVVGNKSGLYACSSPTGPAFEGAQISCGQRAAPGAIERVRIDPESWEPRIRVIGIDIWSDEPGFAAAVETTGITGICGSGIIETVAEMFLAGILGSDGVISKNGGAGGDRLIADGRTWSFLLWPGDKPITVTQNDVRQVQLAKAALYAGVKLLLRKAGIKQLDRIGLAGAFGSHIDPRYAMILGLLPDCDPDKVASIGNAAASGARIALLNQDSRAEIESVVREIEKIETAIEPEFQTEFVDALAIPHGRDSFTRLAAVVDLPKVAHPARSGAGRGRRRLKGQATRTE